MATDTVILTQCSNRHCVRLTQKFYFAGVELQSSYAHQIFSGLGFRTKGSTKGFEGSNEKQEDPFPVSSEVGRKVQARQEPVVLPEAQVLSCTL